MEDQETDMQYSLKNWFLGVFPFFLLVGFIFLLFQSGGGLDKFQSPPVEKLQIQEIRLPEPGMIRVPVVNEGPNTIEIAQVMVDEAYWNFSVDPSTTLKPKERALVHIPYKWVRGAKHEITLISSRGITFSEEIPVAVQSPQITLSTFVRFGMVGVYVGILPILLGLMWFPFIRRLSTKWVNSILAFTVGLLVYLAVGTWLDALEFTEKIPEFLQGIPLIVLFTLVSFGTLLVIGAAGTFENEESQLGLAYRIALGIGLHNLGEGLAIGAAFSTGEFPLGVFLVVGFALHNVTEGIGIAAPLVEEKPAIGHFAGFVGVGGAPAVLGMWIGGFAFSPFFAVLFFAAGLGAIMQVVWDVSLLVNRRSKQAGMPFMHVLNYSGFVLGLLVMYLTGYMIK